MIRETDQSPAFLRRVENTLAALVPDDIWSHPTDFAPEWIDAANLLEDARQALRDSGSDPEGGDALAAPGEASQSGGSEASASPNLDHPLSGQK